MNLLVRHGFLLHFCCTPFVMIILYLFLKKRKLFIRRKNYGTNETKNKRDRLGDRA